jgi:hypothetical protein
MKPISELIRSVKGRTTEFRRQEDVKKLDRRIALAGWPIFRQPPYERYESGPNKGELIPRPGLTYVKLRPGDEDCIHCGHTGCGCAFE